MKKLTLLTVIILSMCTATAQIINIPDDYPTIQEGINAASTGDTVLVAENIYYENIIFNGKVITVASQFIIDGDTNHINNTIIDGSDPENPLQGSVVAFINGEDSTSILSGFTITNGSGLEIGQMRFGGGIACLNSGAKITFNKIINNEVTHTEYSFGGGICSLSDASENWIIIENNSITGNICNATNVAAFGGGIYSGSSARIDNNIISNNTCNCETNKADGGGIETENLTVEKDTVFITNNSISNNLVEAYDRARGGGVASFKTVLYMHNNVIDHDSLSADRNNGCGIFVLNSPYTEIIGNKIINNTVNKITSYWGVGAFILAPRGKTIIKNNEFSFNTGELTSIGKGGGLTIVDAFDSLVLVEKNMFHKNSAYAGGGFYEISSYNVQLINNLFLENESYKGGAINMYHPLTSIRELSMTREEFYPMIINNTFDSNSATNDGGAIRSKCYQMPPVIFNCIFYENEALFGNDVYNWSDSTIVISYSNINPDFVEGNWSGVENISEDPMFVNSGDHPDSLLNESPCINTGTPDTTGLNLPELDLAGNPRVYGGRIEMGAYENQTIHVGINEFEVQSLKSEVWNYPNPFTTSTTIEYELTRSETVRITFYNQFGKQVDVIEHKQLEGLQQVIWTPENLAEGIYYFRIATGRLHAGEKSASGKLVLVR